MERRDLARAAAPDPGRSRIPPVAAEQRVVQAGSPEAGLREGELPAEDKAAADTVGVRVGSTRAGSVVGNKDGMAGVRDEAGWKAADRAPSAGRTGGA